MIESFGLHVPRPEPGVHPTALIEPGATAAREQEPQLAALEDAAQQVPVVYDRNMSQGIAVLQEFVSRAARSPAFRSRPGFSECTTHSWSRARLAATLNTLRASARWRMCSGPSDGEFTIDRKMMSRSSPWNCDALPQRMRRRFSAPIA